MNQLTWTRIPRIGFIASHWIARDRDGKEMFIIRQRITKHGRQGPRTVRAVLIPGHESFDNVAQAKAAAEQWGVRHDHP
jgi:hypothetical protein